MQVVAHADTFCRSTSLHAAKPANSGKETFAAGICGIEGFSRKDGSLRLAYNRAFGGIQAEELSENLRIRPGRPAQQVWRLRVPSKYVVRADGSASTEQKVSTTTLKFKLQRKCCFGQKFWICGDKDSIGSWNLDGAYKMQWTEGDIWLGQVDVPPGITEFKFVLRGQRGELEWQPGPNRVIKVEPGTSVINVREAWDVQDSPAEFEENGSASTSVKETVETGNGSVALAPEKKAPTPPSSPPTSSSSSENTAQTKESKSKSILSKDAAWGSSIWKGLIKSWGRSSLMDEEQQSSRR